MSTINRKLIQKKCFRRLVLCISIVSLVILFINLCYVSLTQLSIFGDGYIEPNYSFVDLHLEFPSIDKELNTLNSNQTLPTIARVLYLFLCENQDEIDAYAKMFPTATADVMFFCWREDCDDLKFSSSSLFYVSPWSGPAPRDRQLVRTNPISNHTKVRPRVFIINERQLNLSGRTTWTVARNILLDRALLEERRQGWRWAYYTFGDGDIQLTCALAARLRNTNKSDEDEIVFAEHFRSLMDNTTSSSDCFLLFDAFLFSASPAIGVIGGMFIPSVYNDLLTQNVYHMDGIFNAFHRDAMPYVLPYCARYDKRTWWTSQVILIYRSVCLYGHVIQFNSVKIRRQKHRQYPRKGDPWAIDKDMNLVPSSLVYLHKNLKRSRVARPLVLRNYRGWSQEIVTDECRQGHTAMHPLTCKVSGIKYF